MSLQRGGDVCLNGEREEGEGEREREREPERERERERERKECAPFVIVRFALTYLRREVVRGANACAGQLHSTAVHHHNMM